MLQRAPNKGARAAWLCQCDCGGQRVVVSSHLTRGNTQSCGCLWRESVTRKGPQNPHFKHGLSHLSEYKTWDGMKRRCNDPTNEHFPHYGGRGIKIHPAWEDDFVRFLTDVGRKPNKDYSLDRIDNNGNYEPSNVRWASASEQSLNRRSVKDLVAAQEELARVRTELAQYKAKFGEI